MEPMKRIKFREKKKKKNCTTAFTDFTCRMNNDSMLLTHGASKQLWSFIPTPALRLALPMDITLFLFEWNLWILCKVSVLFKKLNLYFKYGTHNWPLRWYFFKNWCTCTEYLLLNYTAFSMSSWSSLQYFIRKLMTIY